MNHIDVIKAESKYIRASTLIAKIRNEIGKTQHEINVLTNDDVNKMLYLHNKIAGFTHVLLIIDELLDDKDGEWVEVIKK